MLPPFLESQKYSWWCTVFHFMLCYLPINFRKSTVVLIWYHTCTSTLRGIPEHDLVKFFVYNLVGFEVALKHKKPQQSLFSAAEASVGIPTVEKWPKFGIRLSVVQADAICNLLPKFTDNVVISVLVSIHCSHYITQSHKYDVQPWQIMMLNATFSSAKTFLSAFSCCCSCLVVSQSMVCIGIETCQSYSRWTFVNVVVLWYMWDVIATEFWQIQSVTQPILFRSFGSTCDHSFSTDSVDVWK